MSVKLKGHNLEITKFPAGESKVVYSPNYDVYNGTFILVLDWEGNEDLFNLALVVDAIRRAEYKPTIHLEMPYIPYARQDRVCNQGESLSIKVVADFINSLNFHNVVVCDAHSDVSLALFNNLVHNDLSSCAKATIPKGVFANSVLVSPDAGAMKKVASLGKLVNCPVVVATKQRDTMTGAITNTKVDFDSVTDKDFLIVDDLAEGAYTFTELAKVLRPHTTGKIYLYVTHGIFSKGYKVFDNLIDGIYTYNLMGEQNPIILNLPKGETNDI
jgi:ribose-phosphate pyrophosphokinase